MDRWATFDCYGTLVDWQGGIGGELQRLFPIADRAQLLDRYHELEPVVQKEDPNKTYREVMSETLARVAAAEGHEVPSDESDALGLSLPNWPVFPDVREGLSLAIEHGWKLAILSNTDRDFIEASKAAIGVPFELTIVASEIGSYKPAHKHWDEFFSQSGALHARHVHVAQSLFHDIAPTRELGIPSIWINRQGEAATVQPTRELPDLTRLAETLDGLVPG